MLWICLACTAAYSVGAPRCPQCGSADWAEEGSEAAMPKITVHGGPTNAADDQPIEAPIEPASVDEQTADTEAAADAKPELTDEDATAADAKADEDAEPKDAPAPTAKKAPAPTPAAMPGKQA